MTNPQSVNFSTPVAYFPWTAGTPIEVTIAVYGPSGFANYTPPGTAIVDYYDPYSNQVISEVFSIGGFGASEIRVVTGSLIGNGAGEIKVRVVDNKDLPIGSVLSPGKYLPDIVTKFLDIFGYVDDGISGVFGTPGYDVSQISSESTNVFSVNPNATYPPGLLESKGIDPNNLPPDLEAVLNYNGELVGVRPKSHCFVAGTMIDMWPTDPGIRPDANGVYDKAEVLAKVWKKPVEQITPTDWVVSFDKAGNLQPGRVTRTFTNQAKIILDFFGMGVTPGHVYYRPDSTKPYKFEPLIDILRDDGVVQKDDGKLIRAATGCEVSSEEDREFWAFTVYEDKDGNERVRDKKKLRLGTRWMLPNGNHFSMREYMQGIGLELQPDGYVRWKQTGLTTIFVWTFSETLPNPEDFVLARSGTTLEDIYKAAEWEGIRPDMPPPMVRDGGPVQPLSQAGLTLMPRNTPLAMRDGGSGSMFNRKQRKAAEARERQEAKGKKRLVH